MTNFVPIAFLDTFDLVASLRQRLGLFKARAGEEALLLPLRGFRKDTEAADENFVSYAVTSKWVELANMLSRLRRIGDQGLGAVEFGRIHFEMLPSGMIVPWSRGESGPYAERWSVLHLPLRTSPTAVMYAGPEQSSPGPGFVTIVNVRVPSSAVNLGEHSRIHLVAEFRKKDAIDDA